MTTINHDYPEYAGLLPPAAKPTPVKSVRRDRCPSCMGTGYHDTANGGSQRCARCGGSRFIEYEVSQ